MSRWGAGPTGGMGRRGMRGDHEPAARFRDEPAKWDPGACRDGEPATRCHGPDALPPAEAARPCGGAGIHLAEAGPTA